jgi:integration host factor subunit beta
MTKRDLIRKLAQAYPRFVLREVEVMVDMFFASLTAALSRGERVELRGLGIFGDKEHRARDGRNPRTGQVVRVAAKRVPFFKVAKELRARINARARDRTEPRERQNIARR